MPVVKKTLANFMCEHPYITMMIISTIVEGVVKIVRPETCFNKWTITTKEEPHNEGGQTGN